MQSNGALFIPHRGEEMHALLAAKCFDCDVGRAAETSESCKTPSTAQQSRTTLGLVGHYLCEQSSIVPASPLRTAPQKRSLALNATTDTHIAGTLTADTAAQRRATIELISHTRQETRDLTKHASSACHLPRRDTCGVSQVAPRTKYQPGTE